MERVKAVIFDWAGTVIDYGSLAPRDDQRVATGVRRGDDLAVPLDDCLGFRARKWGHELWQSTCHG